MAVKSFTPGQIIRNSLPGSKLAVVIVLAVEGYPISDPALKGSFVTVLPTGSNKPQGPFFMCPSHWSDLNTT
jgi:hypothetical protein